MTTKKYMADYRQSLLGALIEKKYGLIRKQTKAESMINAFIYDLTKEGLKTDTLSTTNMAFDLSLEHKSMQYDYVESKINKDL